MRLLIGLCLLLLGPLGHAQTRVDTLLRQYPDADADLKLRILIDLTDEFAYRNADSARMFGMQALKLINDQQIEYKFEALHNIAITYQVQSNYEEALKYDFEALRLAESFPDSVKKANIINNIGLIYDERGSYDEAVAYYKRALDFYSQVNNQEKMALVNVNLGVVYKALGDYANSVRNYREALEIFLSLKKNYLIAVCQVNLGSVYLFINKYDSALIYSKMAAQEFSNLKYFRFEAVAIGNVGISYAKLRQYDEAILNLLKAIGLHQQNNNTKELAFCKLKLAEVYKETKKPDLALSNALESNQLAKKAEALQQVADSYLLLSELYQLKGNYKLAFDFQKEYAVAHDSLFERNKISEIRKFQVQYETEKKERDLAISKANLAEKELEIQKYNNQLITMGSLLGLIVILTLGIYRNQKTKQARLEQEALLKEQLAKSEAQNALQQERLRISRELHDNIGSQLTFINASMESLDKGMETPKLTEVKKMTLDTIKELRKTVWLINKQSVSLDEFIIKLREYLRPVESSGTEIVISTQGLLNTKLLSVSANHIFRLIQEAVNNALKHAEASQISIRIHSHTDNLIIEVKDNGKGFDLEDSTSQGFGLKSMEQRSKELGGQILIKSLSHEGTNVSITLPLNTLVEV